MTPPGCRVNPRAGTAGLRDRLAEAGIDADAALREATEPDYVMWAYVTSGKGQPEVRREDDGMTLRDTVASRADGWSASLRRLITRGDSPPFAPAAAT